MDTIIDRLDRQFLDEQGRIKLLPAECWQGVSLTFLRQWCYARGIYGIPTLELVEFLKLLIGDRSAIEIGAGSGDLGFHLGIPQTDSCIHATGKWERYYAMVGQQSPQPGPDVIRLDAATAVARYKPSVVIGSWVTRRFVPGVDGPNSSAFEDGVDEEALLKKVDCYVVVGNRQVHGTKTLLSQPHDTLRFHWLVSRASVPEDNLIYIWPKGGGL